MSDRERLSYLSHQHHLTHPTQLHCAIDDTLTGHRIIKIDLPLALVDLKQCEVVMVGLQRAEIHQRDVLPLLDPGFAAEPFNGLSPIS
jgi:hypothetical protein